MSKLDDKYRLQRYDEDAPPVSLLNETVEYRDRGLATVLHRWPRELPFRAVLLDALAQTQLLLARLDGGVYLTKDSAARSGAEATLRAVSTNAGPSASSGSGARAGARMRAGQFSIGCRGAAVPVSSSPWWLPL